MYLDLLCVILTFNILVLQLLILLCLIMMFNCLEKELKASDVFFSYLLFSDN